MLLLRGDEVLLAMKKRGFGEGKWNGVGGKRKDEEIDDTAKREAFEEIGVKVVSMEKMGVVDFHFPYVPAEKNWGNRVHIYIATQWEGEPVETEEMRPQWFRVSDVPYSEMWWDDKLWMPLVFLRKKFKGSFMFGEDNESVVDYYLDEISG